MGVHTMKAYCRRRFLVERAAISPLRRAALSRRIGRRVMMLSVFRSCRVLIAYAPFRGEVDCLPIVKAALREKKIVAMPRIVPGRRLEFHRIGSPAELSPGAFGILEPPPCTATRIAGRRADLTLVPAVAFSLTGQRLGYGGGYYDRFLRNRHGTALGLAFDEQLAADLPVGRDDERIDALVTPRRFVFFGGSPE